MKDEDRKKYFWVLVFLLLPFSFDVIISIQEGLFFTNEYTSIVQFTKDAEQAHMPKEQIEILAKLQLSMKHATGDLVVKCVNTLFLFVGGFAGLVMLYFQLHDKPKTEKK